ncbi:MAG: indole-3-glycerol phosphate synthase TrpC [Sphingobacteriia bacterium]
MNILDQIIAQKRIEVASRKTKMSIADLEKEYFFNKETLSLKRFIKDPSKTGIIAEFKRKSPSKGIINGHSSVEDVTMAYAEHGASGLSVLTDEQFFGGSIKDLVIATVNEVPILRKDFMIDEYQLIEAKAFGAEVILLIAACLSKQEVQTMAKMAKGIGLEVLLEIHNKEELEHICDDVDLVGVNNRNLKNFEVSIANSLELIDQIPRSKPAIAESGINNVDSIVTLQRAGFKGFLIGEHFMKESSPAIAFANFVQALKEKQNEV